MSVSIGIFDLYSFMIPGLLYLFVFNEAARVIKISYFDLSLLKDNVWLGVGILVLAYITGHILTSLSFRIWFRLFYRHERSERAYNKFKLRMSDVDFEPKKWSILLAVIRRDNSDIAQVIEKNIVDAIMFRNVSFGLALFAMVQIVSGVATGFTPINITTAILSLSASGLALRQSAKYDGWFFNSVFEHAVTFGRTTEEVINSLKAEKPAKRSSKRKNKG